MGDFNEMKKWFQQDGNKYEIGKEIGSGGYGSVYSLVKKGTNEELPFVVKACNLEPDGTCSFALLREIVHLNIFGSKFPKLFPQNFVINRKTQSKRIHIVMERFDADLEKFTKSKLYLWDLDLIVKLASCVAIQGLRAIRLMHQFGIAHRDVKTSNFLLRKKINDTSIIRASPLSKDASFEETMDYLGLSELVLADFSLAKKLRVYNSSEVLTPGYCPPECPEGGRGPTNAYNHKLDVYSLGCVIYEVLTGGRFLPFENHDDPIQFLKKTLKTKIERSKPNPNFSVLLAMIEDMLNDKPSRPSANSLLVAYCPILFPNGFEGMDEELKARFSLGLPTMNLVDELFSKKREQLRFIAYDMLASVEPDLLQQTLHLIDSFTIRYHEKTHRNFYDHELPISNSELWIGVCFFIIWTYYYGDGSLCKSHSINVPPDQMQSHKDESSMIKEALIGKKSATQQSEKFYENPNKTYNTFVVIDKVFDFQTFKTAYWMVLDITAFKILFDSRSNLPSLAKSSFTFPSPFVTRSSSSQTKKTTSIKKESVSSKRSSTISTKSDKSHQRKK